MRTHWFTSPDPPKFGEDLVALCGDIVPKAQPVRAMWDNDSDDLEYGLVKCPECNGRLLHGEMRYAAVIQSGEESIEHG